MVVAGLQQTLAVGMTEVWYAVGVSGWERGSARGSLVVWLERAAAAHQSLQEYLLARLIRDAQQPTLDEVLERAGGRAGGALSLADAVSTLRFERARR